VTKIGYAWTLNPSIQVDGNDTDVYHRYTETGQLLLDWSTGAQLATITVDTAAGGDGLTGLGAWSTSPSFATDYLAATDGFVVAGFNGGLGANASAYMQGKTDGAGTPTTVRATCGVDEKGGIQYNSFMMPVRKGDYWRVDRSDTSGTQFLNWIPLS